MEPLTFRNDDVCANSNIADMIELYCEIQKAFPQARIINGITMFSEMNDRGSVYEEVPFKKKDINWFYENADAICFPDFIPGENASHGLFHIDHTKVCKQTQEMSIIGSCSFLNTNLFIPPFNRFNEDTVDICRENDIELLCGSDVWKSFEFEKFDPKHKKWYFHSWRFTSVSLRRALNADRAALG